MPRPLVRAFSLRFGYRNPGFGCIGILWPLISCTVGVFVLALIVRSLFR